MLCITPGKRVKTAYMQTPSKGVYHIYAKNPEKESEKGYMKAGLLNKPK